MSDRSIRSMLMKLRGGTAQFQIELGRWRGVKCSDRRCWEFCAGDIEDTSHWMMSCPAWYTQRKPLIDHASQDIYCFDTMDVDTKVAVTLDLTCHGMKLLNCCMSCGVPNLHDS